MAKVFARKINAINAYRLVASLVDELADMREHIAAVGPQTDEMLLLRDALSEAENILLQFPEVEDHL